MKKTEQAAATNDHNNRGLPRKYRPRRLDQVIGQESAVTQLAQIIKSKRKPTALLLTGPSGTGKTTLARIFATMMNCDTRDACGRCNSCRLTMQDPPASPDVKETNAAEARGIDDVREMIRASGFSATFNCRILIIDECHQLTPQAMQALLKVVEEPSGDTIWVFATTDPQKLPPALIGRCQKLALRHIDPDLMLSYLTKIARREGMDIKTMKEKGVKAEKTLKNAKRMMRTIVELSNGQVRDALSILDGVVDMHKSGKFPDLSALMGTFLKNFDITSDVAASKALYAVYKGNLAVASQSAYDMGENVRGLLHSMRNMNDQLLREVVKRPLRWQPAAVIRLRKAIVENGMALSVGRLIHVASCLNEAERLMNSVPTAPVYLLLEAFNKCSKYIEPKKPKSD